MKVNVQHMLRMAGNDAGGAFRHSLPELASNLKELRDRSFDGPEAALAACQEFFDIYRFGDESTHPTVTGESP